jgi:hypothetical protein
MLLAIAKTVKYGNAYCFPVNSMIQIFFTINMVGRWFYLDEVRILFENLSIDESARRKVYHLE